MYFNVEYLWEKISGALGTQKWPNEAKNSPNWPKWGKMRFWREPQPQNRCKMFQLDIF